MSLIHVSQPIGYPTTVQFEPLCVHEILVCVHVLQTSYLAQLIANGKVKKGKVKEIGKKEKEKKGRKTKWNDRDETKQNLLLFLSLILQLISAVHLPFLFILILLPSF